MSVSERRKQYPSQGGEAKRPKLGLKFGAAPPSARPLPRVEGAR